MIDRQGEVARSIWWAAVAAADPVRAVAAALPNEILPAEGDSGRLLVVGGGKAGAGMAQGVENGLPSALDRIEGLVNVPEGATACLRRIRLHVARPAGSNFPTQDGVAGVEQMLDLFSNAHPNDIGLCLISGGGSALLPAPVPGVTLAEKVETTRLLHQCGATIQEMNAVRKHLSRVKGGGLAKAFRGRKLVSLVISDVVGDPLDVIASGPTAADATTFADAVEVLRRYALWERVPASVRSYLEAGMAGQQPETLKEPLPHVSHHIIACNSQSLRAAQRQAEKAGYRVLNLGASLEGESRELGVVVAGIVRSILREGIPIAPPCCLLMGGETTVRLGANPGRGGRNQEFVLAFLQHLGRATERPWSVLSAGTDGEDGPTDAAGAFADVRTITRASELQLSPRDFLDRHDSYTFFLHCGGLWRTGLTGTNVMDIRLVLID
jgi:glycerate 2-kinase